MTQLNFDTADRGIPTAATTTNDDHTTSTTANADHTTATTANADHATATTANDDPGAETQTIAGLAAGATTTGSTVHFSLKDTLFSIINGNVP